MDKIGDWLYIVFIIIAGISGLISSVKKKNKPTEVLGQPDYGQPEEQNQPVNKNPWDPFEKGPAPRPKSNNKKKKRETSPFLEGETTSSFNRNIPIPVTDIPEPELEYGPEITINSVEDLRKAVIYSEILNRKY